MEYMGYCTTHCIQPGTCLGCSFMFEGKCRRPESFPKGCSDVSEYIWVKEEHNVGSITVDVHFDMQAFKQDVLEYITNMDLTKYIDTNQGT